MDEPTNTPAEEADELATGISRARQALRSCRPLVVRDDGVRLRFDTIDALLAILSNDAMELADSLEKEGDCEEEMKLTQDHIDQLEQLHNKGVIWDGYLISKTARDELVKKKLVATTKDGWNVITKKGIKHLHDLGLPQSYWWELRYA